MATIKKQTQMISKSDNITAQTKKRNYSNLKDFTKKLNTNLTENPFQKFQDNVDCIGPARKLTDRADIEDSRSDDLDPFAGK